MSEFKYNTSKWTIYNFHKHRRIAESLLSEMIKESSAYSTISDHTALGMIANKIAYGYVASQIELGLEMPLLSKIEGEECK